MLDKMLKAISCAVLLFGIKAFSQVLISSGPIFEEVPTVPTLLSTGSIIGSFGSNRNPSLSEYVIEADSGLIFTQQKSPFITSIVSVLDVKPKIVTVCFCVFYFEGEGNVRFSEVSTPAAFFSIIRNINDVTIDNLNGFTIDGLASDQKVGPGLEPPMLNHPELALVQSETSSLIDPETSHIIAQSAFIHFGTIPSPDLCLRCNPASFSCSCSAITPVPGLLVRVVSPNTLKTQSPGLIHDSSPLNGRTVGFAFTGCNNGRACSMKV